MAVVVGGGVKVITGQLFHLDGSQAEWHFLCPACASPTPLHPLPHPNSRTRTTLRLSADHTDSSQLPVVPAADNGLAYHRRGLAAQLLSNATVTGHEKPY